MEKVITLEQKREQIKTSIDKTFPKEKSKTNKIKVKKYPLKKTLR